MVARLLVLGHGLVACAVIVVPADQALSLAAIVLVAVSLVVSLRQVREAAALRLLLGDELRVRDERDGGDCPVISARGGEWALWLYWRDDRGRRRALMVAADQAANRDAWRLLKVWSRHRLAPSPVS